jgi:hypothetical protein
MVVRINGGVHQKKTFIMVVRLNGGAHQKKTFIMAVRINGGAHRKKTTDLPQITGNETNEIVLEDDLHVNKMNKKGSKILFIYIFDLLRNLRA